MSDKNSSPCCPECESTTDWDGASWCPDCGYYPAINRQVAAPPCPEEDEIFDHWWEVVPAWIWPIVTGVAALFIASVVVRVMFANSHIRTWWTIGQLGGGLIALGVVHFLAYLFAVGRSDKLGPLDMFLQPIKTWQPVFRELPGSSRLVTTLACSIAAIGLAFFVIDGVDYVAFMQADAEARKRAQMEQAAKDRAEGKKKTSAMGFVIQSASTMAEAKQAVSPTGTEAPPESMEDALNGFAGAAGVSGDEGLVNGGGGPAGAGDLGTSLNGITESDSADANSDLEKQRAIANGTADDEHPQGDGSPNGPSDANSESGNEGMQGLQRPKGRSVTKSKLPNGQLRSGDAAASPGSGGSPVSLQNGSSGSVNTSGQQTSTTLTMPAEEVECLVLGYTTNATGELRSLLLAAAPDRTMLRFVAKVPAEEIDPDVLQEMIARFPDIPASRSAVRCPYGGRWLQPKLFCIATYEGWTANRRLNSAQIVRLVGN